MILISSTDLMSKYNYSKKYAQKKLYYIKYVIFAVVMDKNEISLRIIGKNGDEPLSPANFDIGQIRFLLDEVENCYIQTEKSVKIALQFLMN